ncbi:hypothetical protein LENED_012785 [Lentinula edodes]|uniref:Uncharacterized protein n=1 Tax=Lentinula edodes TaxID=5353 RepID=A0A1Q3ETJ5_LENED|nr:hypothetical protein LENED_012785 [Lentinula edodes]
MRFSNTLLPLITLALRVAAIDLQQGIPLKSVSHPANVYIPSEVVEATEANAIVPAAHYASTPNDDSNGNAQKSVSLRCLEEARQEVLAHTTLQQMPHGAKVQVFVESLVFAKNKLQNYVKGTMSKCAVAGAVAGLIILIRQNDLKNDLEIEQCEHLQIDACSNPSTTDKHLSPVTSKAPGGHVKRDSARMSYRRRLELE